MKALKTIIVAVFVMISGPSFAGGGGGVPVGATEVTQLLNNTELMGIYGQQATQLMNEAQMIANQLNMYSNMIQNTQNLSNYQWGQTFTNLQSLSSIVQKGKALAYSMSNVDTAWATRYPGYSTYTAATYGATNFRTDYQGWYETQRDGLHGALRSANLQSQQFATEENTLKTLENMSQSTTGRLQAIKVGNQIAMQQVRQTQKLRELTMAQIQAQTNYLSAQAEKDAAIQARSERHFAAPSTTVVGNGQQYTPGTIVTSP